MNDKCAAGTGRFLEMMARSLEISIDELGPVSLQSKENIEISSMCSVFAESEVISLIAQNKEIADIAHGIHKAIAGKAMSLLKRVGLNPGYMMTGGVAKNPGVVAVLEEQLGENYISMRNQRLSVHWVRHCMGLRRSYKPENNFTTTIVIRFIFQSYRNCCFSVTVINH